MAAIASTPGKEGAVADEAGAGVTPGGNAASCAIDLKVLWPDAITNLKTAPRQLVEVYKAFYMQCPPTCEKTGQDMKEMIRPAYFIHLYIFCLVWLVNLIIYAAILGTFIPLSIVSLLISFAGIIWVLIITTHPTMCCLPEWINVLIFSIVMGLLTLLTLMAMITNFELIQFANAWPGAEAFIVPGLLNCWDLTILLPITVWSTMTTLHLYNESKAAATKVAPEK